MEPRRGRTAGFKITYQNSVLRNDQPVDLSRHMFDFAVDNHAPDDGDFGPAAGREQLGETRILEHTHHLLA